MTHPNDASQTQQHSGDQYRGRFAPSPTGLLHFGSLVAAVASYLDARHHQGQWLVRIEDLDPPREQPGAADNILKTLESFGLEWDGSVLYQSSRLNRYAEQLEYLKSQNAVYACQCTRKQIRMSGGVYRNHCRTRGLPFTGSVAIRTIQQNADSSYRDPIQGLLELDNDRANEDFIVKRRDGLFAYQLAVVVDDIDQNINQVIRGADLLDSTPKQQRLFQLFGHDSPMYKHLPLAVDAQGNKLSKQNYAPAIEAKRATEQLLVALEFLGQSPPKELFSSDCATVLAWAAEHWNWRSIPRKHALPNPLLEENPP